MKLIIGLGNPGEKYKDTRHNVGHMMVDCLKKIGITSYKSQESMNNSGVFVAKMMKEKSISPSDLWIIHDDLDIPLGSFKIQFEKSPKVHNGIKSINERIGTSSYWHIRVGIDNRNSDNRTPGEEYVLQNFTNKERQLLDKTIKIICKRLETS